MVSSVGRNLDDFSIPTSQRAASNDLGQDDFLKLMVEQMRNQNPLDPQDNGEFFSQIAQFQTLDAMSVISEAITTLVEISGLSNASSLIGRSVVAEVDRGPDPETGFPRPPQQVSGIVDRVTFDSNGAVLHIGPLAIPSSAVSEISDPVAQASVDPTAELLAQLAALGAFGSLDSDAGAGAGNDATGGVGATAGDIAAELLAQLEALAALGTGGAEPKPTGPASDDPAAADDSSGAVDQPNSGEVAA